MYIAAECSKTQLTTSNGSYFLYCTKPAVAFTSKYFCKDNSTNIQYLAKFDLIFVSYEVRTNSLFICFVKKSSALFHEGSEFYCQLGRT